jgi:hypothetical protein
VQLAQTKKKSLEYEKLSLLLTEMKKQFERVGGEQSLSQLSPFFNFQLVRSGFVSTHVAVNGEEMAFLDVGQKNITQLNMNSKKTSLVDLSWMSQPLDLIFVGKDLYVLGDDGVYKNKEKIISANESWKKPLFIGAFGQNMYVFDKESRELRRHTLSSSEIDKGVNWFRSTQGFSFDDAVSMAIDGKVWVSTADGKLFKFAQGRRESFEVKHILESFSTSLLISTHEDIDFLAVLEPAKNRVVLIGKDGEYRKAYVNTAFAAASGIAMSQDGKKIFVSAGSLLYQLENQ